MKKTNLKGVQMDKYLPKFIAFVLLFVFLLPFLVISGRSNQMSSPVIDVKINSEVHVINDSLIEMYFNRTFTINISSIEKLYLSFKDVYYLSILSP